MAQILCKECGAENDSTTRFCVRCDAYLNWDDTTPDRPEDQPNTPDTKPDDTRPTPAETSDGAARPPQITPTTTTATLNGDTGAQIDIEVRNRSTIVDAFRIDMIAPPQWLTLNPAEVRTLPNESGLLPAAFAIQSGADVAAQTVEVVIRVASVRDTDQYADAKVSLTVPPVGPPVTIKVQPSVVRLVDQTDGRAQIQLDNTASNYPRTITLTGTDDQAALDFLFSPPQLEIGPGRVSEAEMQFRAPQITEGTTETHTATITATEDKNTSEATLTVNQQRSAVQPLHLRLEPSVVRIKARHKAVLQLVIDNRYGQQDRRVDLEGRDPEGVVQFLFDRPSVVAPAGAVVTVGVSMSAPKSAIADQVQRPFSVVAVEPNRETEAPGTLRQIKSAFNWARAMWIGGTILMLPLAATEARPIVVLVGLVAAAALGARWFKSRKAGDAPQPQATSPIPSGRSEITTPPITSSTGPATLLSKPLLGAVALPPDRSGCVYIRTASKRTRCAISSGQVTCEANFANSPLTDGFPANQVTTGADGDGLWQRDYFFFGDIAVTDIAYQTYQTLGWTIDAGQAGTRFTNDRTGRGMFVSVDKVEFF